MKIKNRILLYNTLMVPLSLIALLLIGSLIIGLWGRGGNRSAARAEAILESVSVSESFSEAERELSELGYTLYVFSSSERASGADGTFTLRDPKALAGDMARIVSMTESSFIVREAPPYLLIAVKNASEPTASSGRRGMLFSFLIIGGISVAVIVAISYILTAVILKHISKPLSALSDGARRVEEGDLSHPISYPGADEFKAACDSFDHMQSHLRAEREKNASFERARTDLVSGISHDLRTPLTSVKGYIKGIQDGIANTPEKTERYLKTAYAKADEIDTLLQRLFLFSNMETGNMPLNKAPVDIWEFARFYADEAAIDPRMQNVRFSIRKGEGDHTIYADSQQLRRVFNNLTENAVKYSGASPLVIDIGIESCEGECTVTFRDNGAGVEPGMLTHIFDQFWRGDSARRRAGASNGLGLYIVKLIIEAHGGDVFAENDGGLKITIILPQGKEEA